MNIKIIPRPSFYSEQDHDFKISLIRRFLFRHECPLRVLYKQDVIPDIMVEISATLMLLSIDLTLLDGALEMLRYRVVYPTILAIHADTYTMVFESPSELQAGKLTSLIGVKNLRRAIHV
ncbi:hypothetical protein CMK12_01610 [Candidatus Poribacteria bacterium]|nr:hypothetical protein [Candidatus Poribacteria bacterium]